MRSLPLLVLGAALLAGCAKTSTRYPSLLPRPNEGVNFAEPVRPAPTLRPDPALDARIAALVKIVDSADHDFQDAARDAEAKVARAHGTPAGSSPWLDAQTALSTLDGLKSRAAVALADLDELAIERSESGLLDYPPLTQALSRVGILIAAQDDRVKTLSASIAAD